MQLKPYKSIFSEAVSPNNQPDKTSSINQEEWPKKLKTKDESYTRFDNGTKEFLALMNIMWENNAILEGTYNPTQVKSFLERNVKFLYKSGLAKETYEWASLIFVMEKPYQANFETVFLNDFLPGQIELWSKIDKGNTIGYEIWFD